MRDLLRVPLFTPVVFKVPLFLFDTQCYGDSVVTTAFNEAFRGQK